MTPLDRAIDQETDHNPGSGPVHDLARERAFHDRCRTAVKAMADDADHRVATGADVSASGADAEALGYELRSHAKELREDPAGPLFFGRIDLEDGRHHHIGRRRISEHPAAAPLVIDWRAPVARTFYQASARDPQGVAVRRRFGWAPYSTGDAADLTGLEDEHLGDGDGPAGDEVPGAVGAIVAGEIERPRVGPMRDIAATIQPEQDDLVRAPLADTVCVQGAPGTGKTAVGLHRAAYLLYTHPRRISRGGMLILGPNRTFLSYISQVLPALGEVGIRQSTLQDEIARHEVRAEDPPAAAAVKHDIRMAAVLHRALYGRVGTPAEPLAVPDGSYRWRVPLDELERIVAEVREEDAPYAIGRERVRSRAVRAVQLQAERRAGPMSATWVKRLGRSRAVTAFVDGVWPMVRPEEVLAALYTDPCDPLLTQAEQEAIRWARPRSYRSAAWSAADLVLLDELAGLLERPDGYGHIVVDEAQDLSPMQCRAIARRARFGSLTVLGDLAQGTTPWAARDWAGQLAHLGKEGASVVALTTGYRVPAAIVDLANRLAGALGVDVPVARSLRHDGELTVRAVDDITAATVEAVRAALECEGSVGVIAAEGAPTRSLRAALLPLLDGEARERVAVLPATLAKGLEYDHVVVAEPAAIAAAEERGLHRLYVVLTRAVSRLDILHTRPLPPQLTAGA
ncbi:HelD family protein [Streptomyces sp. NPDC018833]|uniref:HelD family protein n=1 Tax=Streptomyces sp. NPDC018833 TaxID=3365053 RepID=UPI003797267D